MFKTPAHVFLHPSLRRLAAWLALFALLFAALAPTLSHALAASSGAAQGVWAEVCTAAGAKLINLNQDAGSDTSAPAPVSGDAHFEHCPFCFTHGASHALPPTTTAALTLLDTSYAVPSLYLHAPRPLFIWSAARARAPPAFF